jgi:hypothetical protein
MQNETFFMVFVAGSNQPNWQHATLESAETEAKRLSKLLNRKAYILCTIKSVQLNEFLVEDLRPLDELPF